MMKVSIAVKLEPLHARSVRVIVFQMRVSPDAYVTMHMPNGQPVEKNASVMMGTKVMVRAAATHALRVQPEPVERVPTVRRVDTMMMPWVSPSARTVRLISNIRLIARRVSVRQTRIGQLMWASVFVAMDTNLTLDMTM